MRKRILKIAGAALAFAFISVAGTLALGFVVKSTEIDSSIQQQIASARYWRDLDAMMTRIAEENAELTRENNRASALSSF